MTAEQKAVKYTTITPAQTASVEVQWCIVGRAAMSTKRSTIT